MSAVYCARCPEHTCIVFGPKYSRLDGNNAPCRCIEQLVDEVPS